MLASDSGEMDRARFLLSLGVSLGLEKRDTADTQVTDLFPRPFTPFSRSLLTEQKKIPKRLRPLPTCGALVRTQT